MKSTCPTDPDAIHNWFGLTYASYLVLPRSLLQEMPAEWQRRFLAVLDELNEKFDVPEEWSRYTVQVKDERGRFIRDPLSNYRRPDIEAIDRCRRVK